MRENCTWACKYQADGFCYRCGKYRKWPVHKRPNKIYCFSKETVGDWVHLDILVQAWGTDLPPKRELVRCMSNGIIEVWKEGEWLNDDHTDFTEHQIHKIRYRCFGSTHQTIVTFDSLDKVPRMRKGDRFRVKGSAEHDGLWVCDDYREQRIVCHRILPDYSHGIPQCYRIRNEPWPQTET